MERLEREVGCSRVSGRARHARSPCPVRHSSSSCRARRPRGRSAGSGPGSSPLRVRDPAQESRSSGRSDGVPPGQPRLAPCGPTAGVRCEDVAEVQIEVQEPISRFGNQLRCRPRTDGENPPVGLIGHSGQRVRQPIEQVGADVRQVAQSLRSRARAEPNRPPRSNGPPNSRSSPMARPRRGRDPQDPRRDVYACSDRSWAARPRESSPSLPAGQPRMVLLWASMSASVSS